MSNPREDLLGKANELVNGPRNKDYDEPIDNFQRICDLWNAYLVGIGDRDIEPHDVALLNILQKIARLQHSTDHYDSWVDIAGYAACGWDCINAYDDEPDPEPQEAYGSVTPLFRDEFREWLEQQPVLADLMNVGVGQNF